AARQKTHWSPSSACWTYSSRQGAQSCSIRGRLLGHPSSLVRSRLMMNWLKRLFGGSDSSDSSTSAAPEPVTTPAPEPASTMPPEPATQPEAPAEPESGAGDEPA